MNSRSLLVKAGLPVVILMIVGLVTFGLISGKQPPEQEPKERKPMLVEVMPVQFETIHYRIHSQGTVEPKHQGAMVSEVSGRVIGLADNFVAGGMVRKGDVLAQIEPLDYQTGVKAAEAEVYGAKVALEEEKARARVAEEDWRQFNAEQIPELGLRKPQLAKELANLRAAEARLEQQKRNLERTQIKAPYDAIINSKQVDLGEYVTPGTTMAQLMGTQIAEVRLPVTQSELDDLQLLSGASSKVMLMARSGNAVQSWPATLVRSEGVIDPESRFNYVVAEVIDPYQRDQQMQAEKKLLFGTFVSAELVSSNSHRQIRIPRAALKNGRKVVLVDEQNRIEFRALQIERAEQDYLYVSQGLREGERVVLTPVSALPAGSKVRIAQESGE